MRLDFDTRLTVAFFAGIVGLILQQVLTALGAPVNDNLSYIFFALITGPILEVLRRSGGNPGDTSGDDASPQPPDPEAPPEPQAPEQRDDDFWRPWTP